MQQHASRKRPDGRAQVLYVRGLGFESRQNATHVPYKNAMTREPHTCGITVPPHHKCDVNVQIIYVYMYITPSTVQTYRSHGLSTECRLHRSRWKCGPAECVLQPPEVVPDSGGSGADAACLRVRPACQHPPGTQAAFGCDPRNVVSAPTIRKAVANACRGLV